MLSLAGKLISLLSNTLPIQSQRLVRVVTFTTIAAFSMAMTVAAQDESTAQDNPNVDWHTGREIEKFNRLPISAWWSDAELKDRVMRFSVTQRLSIFLDRRIDPSTMIDMSVLDVTKEQFLWSVAEKFDIGVTRIEDFYYFGPRDSAATLAASIDRLRKTTIKQRSKKVNWSDRQPLKTASIIEPRQILQTLADKNSFRIKNLDAVPHDIWSTVDLPKTTLQTRVAIVLAGFGKTFKRNDDGSEIEIVDAPQITSIEKTFRNVDNVARLAKRLRPDFPTVKVVVMSKGLFVSGPPNEIARIQQMVVAAQKPDQDEGSQKLYTGDQRASRGSVLATAASLTGKKLVYDKANRDLVKILQEQMNLRVVNASAGAVLNMAIAETDLKYEVIGEELRITIR